MGSDGRIRRLWPIEAVGLILIAATAQAPLQASQGVTATGEPAAAAAQPEFRPAGTDALDAVDLSDAADLRRHGARLIRAEPSRGFAVFGQVRESLSGIALRPGGVVYLTLTTATAQRMPVSPSPGRTAFALRFVTDPAHHGKPRTWSVDVDGVETAICTEVDPGAGAGRTCFVEAETVGPRATLRIRAGWRNAFPIVLSHVRSYERPTDPGANPVTEREYRMGLALLTSQGHGFSITADEVARIKGLIPTDPYIAPSAAVLYNLAKKDVAEHARAIGVVADLAHAARLPIRIAPQMHWAGIPSGVPDGAGGTFTDVPYQQITWDEADQIDDPGLKPLLGERYDVRYGLSVPNRWSNTPWLTFNHPRLNQYRRACLRQYVAAWLTVRERLARWGIPHLLPGELSTGEETVYWAKGVDDSAYTEANGGKPRTALLADFNPFVVAAAMADRINLDPRDGLDRNERWWLHQNLSRWQQTIVDWMLEALPPDPIRIYGDRIGMADDLIRRNVYTEPYAMPVFPMRGVNPLRPGLEVGYVREGRSGGEYWSGATMLPWLIKERERGRIALPNLECTGADDGQLVACLQAAYSHGARFATLYNWHHRQNVRDLLRQFADSIRTPPGMAWAPAASGSGAATAERTYRAGPAAFGVNAITCHLVAQTPRLHPGPTEKPQTGTSSGPSAIAPSPEGIRVSIRSLDAKPEQSVTVTVLEPPRADSADGSAARSTITAILPTMFHQSPGSQYVVSVVVPEGSGWTAATADDGQAAITVGSDLRYERWRSFAVADWQDAADIIEAVRRKSTGDSSNHHSAEWLAAATAHLTARRPRKAYAAAVKAEQLLYPCTFVVAEPGAELKPFPIAVECPDERVQVTIVALTPETASLRVSSTARNRVTIRFGSVRTTVDLTAGLPVVVDIDARRR